MEYALHIKNLASLSTLENCFNRIYIGSEFCSKLIPALPELKTAARFAKSEGLGLTILTSYCSESQLPVYKSIIDFVREDYPEAEIAVNDWGIFNLCVSSGIKTIIGRLLVKQKNDPRICTAIGSLSSGARSRAVSIGMNNSLLNFLKKKDVKRIELNNTLQGVNLDNINDEFIFSLHLPFVFISLTRYCGQDLKDNPEEFKIKECLFEACPDIEIYSKNLKLPLFRRGNAIFYKNELLPKSIFSVHHKIDRIVYSQTH
jgi:hypothetical protein